MTVWKQNTQNERHRPYKWHERAIMLLLDIFFSPVLLASCLVKLWRRWKLFWDRRALERCWDLPPMARRVER